MRARIPDPLYAELVRISVERRLFGRSDRVLRVGRFEILDRIGVGGMSVVYAARDPELHRTVAIKLLQDETRAERLVRESRALARVRHPHVVTVYDVGFHGDHLFIAMEHVEGAPLGRWARAPGRTWREIARVLRDVADGLAAVHDLGLVHRDVKPDNVVVDARGSARLLDFGLVSAPRDIFFAEAAPSAPPGSEAVTMPGGTPGTPRYMAPERQAGEPATPASDQYALGVSLEEALEGLGAPSALLAIARRARSERPQDRFADLRALRDAIDRLISPRARPAALAAAVLTGVAGLGLVLVIAARAAPCSEGARIAAEHWDRHRNPIEHSLPSGVIDALDRYASGWAAAHRDLCLRRSLAAPARAELEACLDDRLGAFDDAVRALASGDRETLARASDLAAELPPLEDCRIDEGAAPDGGDPRIHVELAQGTTSEEARNSVRRGLRALRDGDVETSLASLEAAARRDPGYGAPRLWLAILYSHGDVSVGRPWFAEAWSRRAGMSAANRAMLAALVPCIQSEPIDDAECEERLERVTRTSPRNAFAWYELARHRWNRVGSSPEVIDAFERAIEADPGFALARFAQGQALAYLARWQDALASIEACLRASPGSTLCLRNRIWIRAHQGDCPALAEDARRWVASSPSDPNAYEWLAAAALANGESIAAVEEMLHQSTIRRPSAEIPFHEARDGARLAVLRGDFSTALSEADAMDAALADSAERRRHLGVARLRIAIALETGDRTEAARLAERALAVMSAWTPDPRVEDFAIASDDEPALLDALREAGAIDDAERAARRHAWLGRWRGRAGEWYTPFLALAGYVRRVDDEAEAREAEAATRELGLPPFHPYAFADSGIGRMHFFAGRAREAVPALERAAHACHGPELGHRLELPFDTIQASRDLGRALEASGEIARACAAYARVIAHWGAARPRSLTAEDAAARRAALACPP